MDETVIKIENLKKKYRLGVIGSGTLSQDLKSWWAKKRGKSDPNTKIGADSARGEKGDFWALNGINLEIHRGEAVGIIGANGAGKSTLLKVLSRVTAPSEGEIKIKGRIASMLEVGTGFHGELTGRENIYMNGAILGMNRKEVDSKIDQIIDFSECREFIDTPVKRYSSGMYVKLAFAVAAHLDAEILVMDEVLAVGDMKFQSKCLNKMDDVAQNEGRTVLYVSHNMNTIRQLCTRCIVLKQGEVIFDGNVEEAIRIYMDVDNRNLRSVYDLRETARPSGGIHGKDFFLTELSFVGKEDALFYGNEPMQFKLKWRLEHSFDDLQMLLTVMTEDGRVVGTSQSVKFCADQQKGMDGAVFDFDIGNIVEGKYFFVLDIVRINEFGSYVAYDHPNVRFHFDVLKDKDMQSVTWQHKYWGNVRLDQICEVARQ